MQQPLSLAPGQRMQFCPPCSMQTVHAPLASGLMTCLRCHFMAEQSASERVLRQQAMQTIQPSYATPQYVQPQQRVVYVQQPSGGSFLGGVVKLVFAIFVAIVVGVMVMGWAAKKQKEEDAAAVESAAPAEIVTVSAKQLAKDYAANGVRADGKYKGKVLSVSGTIEDIDKDILDRPYVTLRASSSLFGVQCVFSNEAGLAELRKGQKVTLRGIGAGGAMGIIELTSCAFE